MSITGSIWITNDNHAAAGTYREVESRVARTAMGSMGLFGHDTCRATGHINDIYEMW